MVASLPSLPPETYPPGRPSNSLHYVVGKIDGKLDQMLLMFGDQKEDIGKLHGRVGSLEKWQARIIGGGAALTFIVTASEIIRVVFTHKA